MDTVKQSLVLRFVCVAYACGKNYICIPKFTASQEILRNNPNYEYDMFDDCKSGIHTLIERFPDKLLFVRIKCRTYEMLNRLSGTQPIS